MPAPQYILFMDPGSDHHAVADFFRRPAERVKCPARRYHKNLLRDFSGRGHFFFGFSGSDHFQLQGSDIDGLGGHSRLAFPRRPTVIRIKDGEGRRSRLWKTGQVLMKLNPTMTRDILFKVLQRELEKYYDNHIDIIPLYGKDRSLEGIVNSVYDNHKGYNLTTSKHGSFKINSAYWKKVMSERNGTYNPMIAVSECRKEITMERLSRFYNPGLSVKENHKILLDNNIDISMSSLYRYKKMLGNSSDFSHTHNYSANDNNIIKLMKKNELISIGEMAQTLNLSESKVKRIIARLKEDEVIERIGTKRNYKWVVLIETDD